MANEIVVTLRTLWRDEDPDMSICEGCEETIYSQMKVLCVEVDGKVTPTELKLCASCHQVVSENC